ncbi:hypothetical protein GF312_11865 [Candidatus Poribacteria bacterium]|nr:hypothetical protein [Candidatus Poribacteria bacterium]
MKKKVLILIYVIVTLALIYIVLYRYLPPYSPTKVVNLIGGIKVSNRVNFEKNSSFYSFTGEGSTEIILKLTQDQYSELIRKNKLEDFNELPISEKLPETLPEKYFIYMDVKSLNKSDNVLFDSTKTETSGYYRFKKFSNNDSYRITIIDRTNQKILIYSFND